MRKFALSVIAFWLCSSLACATPTQPADGAEYKTLTSPQPVTAAGKKVEVIEFFMYHCPACYQLEPLLLAWVAKQGGNVTFRRIHLPHNGAKDVEAHMFLALEALNLEEGLHAKILNTWHVEHHQLTTDDDNISWAIKNGVDKNKFIDAYYSFSVSSKLNNLMRVAESYLVNSTPTLVIDGRYITGPGLIQESNPGSDPRDLNKATLQVADFLVEKARSGK